MSAKERERLYAKRYLQIESNYNQKAHNLSPLNVGSFVRIQSKGKWDRTGSVVEVLPNRQYRVKVDGSWRVTLRNRRFLKLENRTTDIIPASYSNPASTQPSNLNSDASNPELDMAAAPRPPAQTQETSEASRREQPTSVTDGPSDSRNVKLPRALKALGDFNKKGSKESTVVDHRLRSGRDPSTQ